MHEPVHIFWLQCGRTASTPQFSRFFAELAWSDTPHSPPTTGIWLKPLQLIVNHCEAVRVPIGVNEFKGLGDGLELECLHTFGG